MNKQEIRKETNSAIISDSSPDQLRKHTATALLHSIIDQWFSTLTRNEIRTSYPVNSGAKKLAKDLSFERSYGRGEGKGALKKWTKKVYCCTLINLSEIFGDLLTPAQRTGTNRCSNSCEVFIRKIYTGGFRIERSLFLFFKANYPAL